MLAWVRLATTAVALATSSAPPVVVDAGHPVRVRIVRRVPIVDGQTLAAALVDPVYVQNRLAVAAGAIVTGRLETFPVPSRRENVAARAGGDLTPPIGARVRFDSLTPIGEAPIHIAAGATIDAEEPAPRLGEWVKDYLLTQLPYHRRYAHVDATLTMTFVEPVTIARLPVAPASADAAVPARLLTRIDTASASVGDVVQARLLAPVRSTDGREIVSEGAVVTGAVARVARARAFGRGGDLAVRFDGLSTAAARSDPPIRFIWPPLAALALVGARDPESPDQSTFFGRAGAGWSGFLVIGAAVAQLSEPVALGLGAWGLAHSTWINVLRRGRDVVLPADSIVVLTPAS